MKIELSENQERILETTAKFLNRIRNPKMPMALIRNKRFTTRPKNIILHDVNCLNSTNAALNIDGPDLAIGALKVENISIANNKDLNFHFIIDRYDQDYEIITGRPMNCLCHHDDIDSAFENSLHVMILSDLNVDVPSQRFYKILAYRCLAPLIRMLRMGNDPQTVLKYHDDILKTGTEKHKCPGDFLVRELLVSQTRRFL